MQSMMGGLDDWTPAEGGVDSLKKKETLLSTEARDNPDNLNATNALKRFNGTAKKPKGPFGTQGQEF